MNDVEPQPSPPARAALAQRHCKPCQKGTLALAPREAALLAGSVPTWQVQERDGIPRLERTLTLPDFRAAIAFVDRVAEVAEAEGHHPDFAIRYNLVTVSSWTHVAHGLTENDFILAAKIDGLVGSEAEGSAASVPPRT
jgi:4a-hydroxytetrahydrobiopterin dehydratase